MKEVLEALNLTHLTAALPTLVDEARQQQLSYEAFLRQALQAEVTGRQERARQRRLLPARLPAQTQLEAFDFSFQPTLSERVVRELAGLSFVQTATNVVFLGPPGVGKTHLACALAARAIDAGYSARFVTVSQLVSTLGSATYPTTWRQRLRRFVQPKVLVLDEVGYTRLTQEQAHQLFELVTARYEHGPLLLTSNLSFVEWGTLLGNDEVLATALLDRLLHHAEVLNINGRSYRMKDRMLADTPANQGTAGGSKPTGVVGQI